MKSIILSLVFLFALVSCAQAGRRIYGGTVATTGQFPYLVRLLTGGSSLCDGQIIDKYHVATAAHCLQYPSYFGFPFIQVNYGAVNINDSKVVFPISAIVHPEYSNQLANNSALFNDVALLRFRHAFDYTTTVNKIELADDYPDNGDAVIVAGYGTTESGSVTETLLWVSVPYVDTDDCSELYPDIDEDQHVCAGEAAKGTCQGDSGGPLIIGSATNASTHELLGITSYGAVPCGSKANVFANVVGFAGDWLTETKESGEECRKACRSSFIICKVYSLLPQSHNRRFSTCRDYRRICNKTCPPLA